MATLFRPDPEEELEDLNDSEAGDSGRAPADTPDFALIVSEVSVDGWHMAAVVGAGGNPEFYVRALTVRWPFLIGRPVPSNRISDKPRNRHALTPTGTTPAHKVVVNWAWEPVEESVSQLRFYIKRTAPGLFRSPGRARVRLTLKESGWPRRRLVVPVDSNSVIWNPLPDETPASPPAKST